MKIRTRGLFAGLTLAAVAFAATATIDPERSISTTSSSWPRRSCAAAAPAARNWRRRPPSWSAIIASSASSPPGKSYLQPFPVTTDAALGKANRFHITEDGHTVTLHCPDDFVPFNFSETGPLAGAVVFAGYGITAPEYSYDDYAGLDVKGKIVLVLRHEPQESDAKSVFEGKT